MVKVLVVNMIPNNWSDEQNQDAEPCLSVNPANPQEMLATAFTFDNPAGSSAISPAMTGNLAPVYHSTDGGNSWSLHFVLPTAAGAILPTFDVTARFGGTSGRAYSGLISSVSGSIIINRAPNAITPEATLVTRSGDQPFAEATTASVGPFTGNDVLFVGYNAIGATLDQSQNASAPAPTFTTLSLDARNASGGPKVRTAIHSVGTIYVSFYTANPDGTWDVIVVKDLNWGASGSPYQALIGADGKAGAIVAKSISIGASGTEDADFGHDRRGWELAIAVDPNNDQRVYVVYNTGTSAADYTLHVVKSTDGGATWSADVRTIVVAKNPGIAINSLGHVGFAYQAVVGPAGASNWVTIFEHSRDDFATFDSHTLANVPSSTPTPATDMATYIGDYIKVQAVGRHFYGVFSAGNAPVLANFPSGIRFQRNVNTTAQTLLGNDGVTVVPPSIDPFFFKVTIKTPGIATAIANSGFFGDVCLGSFADETLTINNHGSGALRIFNIISTLVDFEVPSVLSYPLKVKVGDSIDLTIRFRPTILGFRAGKIEIFSNDPASPHVVDVSGDCPAPRLVMMIADRGDFGACCRGSFVDECLVLNNSGKCRLGITGISSSMADFEVPEVITYPLTIGPGNSLPVPIRFAPTSHGPKSATITVFSDDPGGPRTINVAGFAPAGKLAVSGSTTFGGVNACCCADRTLSVCNVGDCALRVTSVHFKRRSRHWRILHNPFPAKLHPGSCLPVVIQYHATEKARAVLTHKAVLDDPETPVKIVEALAYTIWDCSCKEGCGKEDCDDCRKNCCDKVYRCRQGYPCCDDDDDEDRKGE